MRYNLYVVSAYRPHLKHFAGMAESQLVGTTTLLPCTHSSDHMAEEELCKAIKKHAKAEELKNMHRVLVIEMVEK